MVNNEKTILVLHKDNGKFYKAIGLDGKILNYLFGYQIINNRVGFPDTAIDKVLEVLDDMNISYQIIYQDVDPFFRDFGEKNKYIIVLKEANDNYEINCRIDAIFEKLHNLDVSEKEHYVKKIEKLFS